jgi:hypothetical protein
MMLYKKVVAWTQQQNFKQSGELVREYGGALGLRVIHRLSTRAGKRWKWLLKSMDVVQEKAARKKEI